MELDVLPNKHSDTNTGHVEGVEEFMYIIQAVHAHSGGQIPLERRNAHRHDRHNIPMPMMHILRKYNLAGGAAILCAQVSWSA